MNNDVNLFLMNSYKQREKGQNLWKVGNFK